jgi:hypothetical protein
VRLAGSFRVSWLVGALVPDACRAGQLPGRPSGGEFPGRRMLLPSCCKVQGYLPDLTACTVIASLIGPCGGTIVMASGGSNGNIHAADVNNGKTRLRDISGRCPGRLRPVPFCGQ